MKYLKKNRAFIIFAILMLVAYFVVLPYVQEGYSSKGQSTLKSYALNGVFIFLAVAWVCLSIAAARRETLKSAVRITVAALFFVLPFFFVLKPIAEVLVFVVNSSFSKNHTDMTFKVVFTTDKGRHVNLLSAADGGKTIRLDFPNHAKNGEGDSVVLVQRSGLLGVARYTSE